MSKLLVVDFASSSILPGAAPFFEMLESSRVVVVPATVFSDAAAVSRVVADGNEIVGFAGDSNSNVELAAQVAKVGGVIFAYGSEGPLASLCSTSTSLQIGSCWCLTPTVPSRTNHHTTSPTRPAPHDRPAIPGKGFST